MKERKYAVIIDEAHSSQSGISAKKMKQVLSANSLEEAEKLDSEGLDKIDEEILREIESSKNLKNVSFFAFTATPKNKTIEMFGKEGKEAYHLYSMKQAIEEGFILDVVKNYLSYETYFKLIKKIEDDPEYESKKSKKLLRNFVEKHDIAISKKAEIMLDHFMNSTKNRINGKAKAMIVTRSRLHAVRYKRVIDKLIENAGYNIKTLVAFTGIVKYNEQEYTEKSLNNLPSKKTIENAFEEEKFKILIVADKFQTGFDQPLLHTMYVDKILNGITAVQTLSRLNRINHNKNETLVLDFANKTEVIQKAFEPYYKTTFLKELTDPHKLYELQDKLYNTQIFDETEVKNFVKSYKKGEHQIKLHNILNPIVDEFNKKTKTIQKSFKKTLIRYQNIYSFLSQLIPFSDIGLEKLFIFNKFLLKKIPTINDPLPFNILSDVDMDSYKIVNKGRQEIILEGYGELKPMSSKVGDHPNEETEKLSKIINDLNNAFGTDFNDDDKVFLGRMVDNFLENKEFISFLENNSKQNVKAVFNDFFNKEMSNLLNNNFNLYKKISENDKLRERLKSSILDLIYFKYNLKKKKGNGLEKYHLSKNKSLT